MKVFFLSLAQVYSPYFYESGLPMILRSSQDPLDDRSIFIISRSAYNHDLYGSKQDHKEGFIEYVLRNQPFLEKIITKT